MTITIRPELEQRIAGAIKAGEYKNAEEVIDSALEMLFGEEEWTSVEKRLLDEKIDRANEQFDRGECFTPEEARSSLEARKTAWLAARG